MTTDIQTCAYSPDPGTSLYNICPQHINELLKKGGTYDVSDKVARIAQHYFGYKGKNYYEVTLEDNHIQLNIYNGANNTTGLQETRDINWNTDKWELVSGGTATPVDGDVTNDFNETLKNVRNAWDACQNGPSHSGSLAASTSQSALVGATSSTGCTVTVNCNHPSIDPSSIDAIHRRLDEMQRSLAERTVDNDHTAQLQREIQRLLAVLEALTRRNQAEEAAADEVIRFLK